MRITTANMRKYTSGWLQEEKATSEQALQLLDALYGGVIDGATYHGDRNDDDDAALTMHDVYPPAPLMALPPATEDTACGCLVDTLERIRGERPDGEMSPNTTVAFALALKIPFGGTPGNNAWAKAAAQGVEDYLATLETANA